MFLRFVSLFSQEKKQRELRQGDHHVHPWKTVSQPHTRTQERMEPLKSLGWRTLWSYRDWSSRSQWTSWWLDLP